MLNLRNVPKRLDGTLETLSPGYFALVMATGIIAAGLAEARIVWASHILITLACAGYLVLAVLYLSRWLRHRARVRADERDPEVAFGYFTVVAGSSVIALDLMSTRFAPVSVPLLAVAAAIWFFLGYLLPWRVLMTRDGEPILARTNGTWFVWSVASQSVAVGFSAIHQEVPQLLHLSGILAVLSWSVGTLLYAGIAILVILRIVHYGVTPHQAEPTYWVAMGALAISVVAGASIVEMPSTPMVDVSRSLIGGTVVIFWCFGAWLIPMLVGAGLWRHVVHRVPLRYTPGLWSMVFPLGMFALASMKLGRIEHLPAIEGVGTVFLGVAVLVWALVATGLSLAAYRWLHPTTPNLPRSHSDPGSSGVS